MGPEGRGGVGLGDGEAAQQDAILLVENDRADRATQIQQGHPRMLST